MEATLLKTRKKSKIIKDIHTPEACSLICFVYIGAVQLNQPNKLLIKKCLLLNLF